MLKHPDLTLRRIALFLKQELAPSLLGPRAPLKIEVNDRPAKDQREAEKGPWREVKHGFEYGPAYATKWFRVSGEVPPEMAGKELAVLAEVGGERTVWRDNSPFCGIDVEHSDFGWVDGKSVSPLNSCACRPLTRGLPYASTISSRSR